jgi:two-component system, NtrC family, sensor kinase
MKRFLITILLLQVFSFAESQLRFVNTDSLKRELNSQPDTTRVLSYASLCFNYTFWQVDSALAYGQKAIHLANQIQFKQGEATAMFSYAWALWASGNYDKAIEAAMKALNLYEDLKYYKGVSDTYDVLAVIYREAEDYGQALKYGLLSKNIYDSLSAVHEFPFITPYPTIASIYAFTNQIDSALFYISKQYEREYAEDKQVSGYTLDVMGGIQFQMKNYSKALDYFHSIISPATTKKNLLDIAFTYNQIAQLYQETGNMDSAIWYAKEIVSRPRFSNFQGAILEALTILAHNYRLTNHNDSALKYLELRVSLNDSLFNKDKTRAIQNMAFNEQMKQQEIEAARMQVQNRVKMNAVFALSGVFLLIGIILYRNNKLKQKANLLLQRQKEKIESTLKALESTQAQLIQSEKMASLGELTAGIAHEIQNPLNFVNNFSEINEELLSEMKEEMEKGNMDQAKNIANTVIVNQQKINQHGNRAGAIVKGMLQHSQNNAGQKELTDLNALADEYLKLSYHGFRAKENGFTANIKADFDRSIEKINIIPQDIGRVLLNLYNNAFYAVAERKKQLDGVFEPIIEVASKKKDNMIELTVRDNGNGIPQKIVDKIFQPFFTTKPTGQGTGLGLSLSYDIVKAHGGSIRAVNREGEGAEFVVQIPLT